MGLALLTQHRQDAPAPQFPPQGPRVIPPLSLLSLQLQRPSARPALLALERRNGIHQRQGLRHIMGVGSRQPYGQRDALTVGDDVVLATGLGPVSRVGTCLLSPKTARTEVLSRTARRQSMRSAACRRSRQARWMRCQTPWACQSRSRRQQVIPLPQFISLGRFSQGMPVFSTNRMPVRTCQSGILGLPP
jgi:hypothetical protein